MQKLPLSLIAIVEMLSDGAFHDGNTIGTKLNITHAEVWKAIKRLGKYEIKLHFIKGKGYALTSPLILLNEANIKQGLENKKIAITVFETINSTNQYLKTFIGEQQIKICLSEHQTNGRGRLGRNWHSPFGCNIYFSCLYPFKKDISRLSGLSIVVGLVIVNMLEQFNLPEPVLLKWPNDIIYKGKKLAGILIEIQAEVNGLAHAIVGIGLNVNMASKEENFITQPWISLENILNKYVDRNQLSILLINNLMTYLEKMNHEGFLPFLPEWEKADSLRDKKIAINDGNIIVEGYARGINEQGNLLVELEDNSIKAFSAGEASIVKQ